MTYEKYKNHFDYSYTLGIQLTIELLLKRPNDVLMVYFSSDFTGPSKEKILKLTKELRIVPTTNDKIFNILSSKENVYTIGVFKKYKNDIIANNHLLLVNPSNAGNLGTIIRTTCGFNLIDVAIIKPCVDIFDPKTIRATMGALFNVRFNVFNSLDEYLKLFPNNNLYPFMLKAKNSLKDTSFTAPYTLVFGNEATGLSDEYLKFNSVIINHTKNIDSLNLPIACSIAIYEATKHNFN